jgi:hypothetical protein
MLVVHHVDDVIGADVGAAAGALSVLVEQCVGVGIGVVSVWIECHHIDGDGVSTQINNLG